MNEIMINTASEEEFAEEAVVILKEKIETAIADHGSCILGLSGGSTPRPIYEDLGREPIDWGKVSIFLIDERYTNPDGAQSNQKLIRETLLLNASIPESQVIFPDTTLPIDECMEKYTQDLKELFSDFLPDVVVLGIGEDGHIASLFPPVSDLALSDQRFVVHTETDQFDVHDRISLALNVIAAGQHHIFLLKGEGKKNVWEEMLASDEDEKRWPAKRIFELQDPSSIVTFW